MPDSRAPAMLGLTCRMLGPCWTHVGVSWVDVFWVYVGPMLGISGPKLAMLALCCWLHIGPLWAYLGLFWPCFDVCWQYVGISQRMLATCCICVGRWPMLTYVGRTWAYVGDVGPMLALRRPILVDVGSVLTYIC